MLSEINQIGKDKYCMGSLTHESFKKKKKKQSNSWKQRVEQWFESQGLGSWENADILVKGHKLFIIRLTSSGGLMYSMVIIAKNTVLYI